MKGCNRRRHRALAAVLWALGLGAAGAGGAAAQEPTPVPANLTLADAIRIAMEGSTQIGIRQAQLSATRTARVASLFALGPDIQVQGVMQKGTRTDFDVAQTVPTSFDTIQATSGNEYLFTATDTTIVSDVDEESAFRQVEVSSSIRLFDGLANYYRIGAASNDVAADEYDALYTSTVVQTNVIEAYYNLLRAKMLLRVAQDAVGVAQEQLERTQALHELGSAARSDVLKSQVQLGQNRLTLVRARNGERLARTGLVHAMNLTQSTPFAIDTTLALIPDQEADFETEVEYAKANRLDVKALREAESAQGKRVVVARGPLMPSVDFSYTMSLSDQESQFRFGAQKNRNRSWAFFANWNVFDRYQVYANISQAKANRRIAEYNRRQIELDAVREIRDFVNQLQEARERHTVASENVERSREDLRLAQEKFRVGAGTILEVTTAESDLTTTRASEVEALVDFLISRARLNRATGRPLTEL